MAEREVEPQRRTTEGAVKLGEAAARFLSSMTMTFDMWHDGTGYDLDALKGLSTPELEAIERALIDHHPRDWRDIEALAAIGSPRAMEEIEAALNSPDAQVRREARRHAGATVDATDRERLLVQSLENDGFFGGLGQAIDEVAEFHPPGVVDALFRGALRRDGEAAVHFAALLFYLHGKAAEPFDWDHRPFFLRFHTADPAEREAAFRELCQRVGVDPGQYLH